MQQWHKALLTHWGLTGQMTPLAGYWDLNFLIESDGKDSARYVLKIMAPEHDPALIDMQIAALIHLEKKATNIPLPHAYPTHNDTPYIIIRDDAGHDRIAWLISALAGIDYADYRLHDKTLLAQMGQINGQLLNALKDFDHPSLTRDQEWDLMQAAWVCDHFALFDETPDYRDTLKAITTEYQTQLPMLQSLPFQAIHNDLNDYNILVDRHQISGIIDFGDMVSAPRVCDIAITATYMMLGHDRPLKALTCFIEALHKTCPLTEDELSYLYPLIKMRCVVSQISAALNRKSKPDDDYITISMVPVRRLLEQCAALPDAFVLAKLRMACGFDAVQQSATLKQALTAITPAPLFKGIDLSVAYVADFSVDGIHSASNPHDMDHLELVDICDHLHKQNPVFFGRYGEPRLLYTQPPYYAAPYQGADRRTIHVGCDIFIAAGTALHTPLDATVVDVSVSEQHLDYGGHCLLKHELGDGNTIFTLYGHLAHDICDHLSVGQDIKAGDKIGHIGAVNENGGWPPHLHFQLGYYDMGGVDGWIGAAYPDDWDLCQEIIPNPAMLLGVPEDLIACRELKTDEIKEYRSQHTPANLKTSYNQPLMLLRGYKHYLYDDRGRPYLDAYNNVPHVGHAYPDVVAAVQHQTTMLNTNSRYLHPLQQDYTKALLATLPAELDTCFFVTSGSEANELALRVARAYTGSDHIITPRTGYHGHTNAALAISDYKFSGTCGRGQENWVHLVDAADTYRGTFQGPDAAKRYAAQVAQIIKGPHCYSYIAETFPSVAGQIIPPKGYLKAVYEHIHAQGGLAIADEVQTGFGRLGHYFWGFEHQDVIPDILVLGKPMGNGYPLAAVITRRDIAQKFDPGMEFFSTFGGSTVALAAGHAMLQTLKSENLQQKALTVGDLLLNGLKNLMTEHAIIGDVRGIGLFIGVELVKDRQTKEPATEAANFLKNTLKDQRILIGTDGKYDNVLKIRPPLSFTKEDAEHLLKTLGTVFHLYNCQ